MRLIIVSVPLLRRHVDGERHGFIVCPHIDASGYLEEVTAFHVATLLLEVPFGIRREDERSPIDTHLLYHLVKEDGFEIVGLAV